ncbi:hypothetical protein HXX76_002068 [Chlamydomonas incerta]|uniref:Uncharacterized protein n=1 Tax=Chlamydomonas incerta TaxID=51695 RepID=A0A836B096_CHLIN|nr:hypothetical protein HXX76_002068 [Chlamydomonas incerta]|eukprot:KAG2443722.1 hypothetical protein HXX76_002068 [Chlamydomonas incerta]
MDKGVVSAAALELLKTELQTHRRNLALICGRGTSTGPISRGQAAPDAASVPAATLSAQPGKTGNPGQQQAAGQATAKEVAAALGDVAAAAYLAVLSTTRGELRGAVEADIGTCDQAPRASSAASDPALMQRPKAPAAGSSRDQSATTASGGSVGLAAGSGGGGRGSATSVIVSSQNVARLGVAAAAADLPLVAATDAYAALRAWRAKRAWAAAVICGAARRYLDRR